jgi:glucose-6-phosphate isomerase
MDLHADIFSSIDLSGAALDGGKRVERRLSDLEDYFADADAYRMARAEGDPIIYTVSSRDETAGGGQLHYGLGVIRPGKIGDEYHLTKGHLHTWRDAAELYIGLEGEGKMLLEDEETGESRLVPLTAGGTVYVPGHTAHRTINTGSVPLKYLGIYPAEAGHDYAFIKERNFRKVLLEGEGGEPLLRDRKNLEETQPAQATTSDGR